MPQYNLNDQEVQLIVTALYALAQDNESDALQTRHQRLRDQFTRQASEAKRLAQELE
jgi:hypothetical protein